MHDITFQGNYQTSPKQFDNASFKSDNTVIEIIQLYNLMKKQAILVAIAVLSTTGIGIAGFFESEFLFEMGWDATLTGICLWMTLSTSRKYWDFCKNYGLCKCCYLKTGNIN